MTETAAARSGFSAAGSRFLCSHVLGRPGVGTADTQPRLYCYFSFHSQLNKFTDGSQIVLNLKEFSPDVLGHNQIHHFSRLSIS